MGDGGAGGAGGAARTCRVLIVGAGAAGLAAANHLLENGVRDLLIVEARGRVGGRIVSVPLGAPGGPAGPGAPGAPGRRPARVELGANWIHGVLGNPLFELAMAHSLVDVVATPRAHRVIAAAPDGKQAPFPVLHEIYSAYVCFLRRCEEYFLCQYSPPPDVRSVGEHVDLEAAIYLDRLPLSEERCLRRRIFDCLLKRETCISGCDSMNEIDLLELGSYTELQGGNVMLPAGYSAILDPLTRNIDQDRILTGRPVVKIYWDESHGAGDDGDESDDSDKTVIEDVSKTPDAQEKLPEPAQEASTSEKPNRSKKKLSNYVEVVCENGEKYYANHVIVTIPLGVLKEKADSIFVPRLPQYKTEAIERLLFGTVDKIFLDYDRPFLNPNVTEVMLLWDTPDAEEELEKSWYKKIYSFSKVSETLLLGWISGKAAEYMETLPSDVVASTCTKLLRQFLNDPYIPEPQSCICTSWKSQQYTRGSYTAIAVGATQGDIESIAEPIFKSQHSKPVLLFAGEHTHGNFYSTVHGAYLSGRTAAQQILAANDTREVVVECNETNDLSSWIQGISLQ